MKLTLSPLFILYIAPISLRAVETHVEVSPLLARNIKSRVKWKQLSFSIAARLLLQKSGMACEELPEGTARASTLRSAARNGGELRKAGGVWLACSPTKGRFAPFNLKDSRTTPFDARYDPSSHIHSTPSLNAPPCFTDHILSFSHSSIASSNSSQTPNTVTDSTAC